jgi:hypothetical protein
MTSNTAAVVTNREAVEYDDRRNHAIEMAAIRTTKR